MDIISSYEQQHYEQILNEINNEFEKCELLKSEIARIDDAITFLKLGSSSCRKKISYVNVKVFDSCVEIENLYDYGWNNYCNIQSLCSLNDCNFFLIEVFLTKSMLTKLIDTQWKLQIIIKTDSYSNSKVVALGDKANMNAVLEVIPVRKNIYECVVETNLVNPSDDNEWNIIELCSININISYFLESYKENTANMSAVDTFFNIAKLYNSDKNIDCFKASTQLQAQLKCNFDNANFVPTFVRNSYHRLNLESFSEFINDNKRVIDFQLSINGDKVIVLYHKDTSALKIKCSSSVILMLKTFFMRHSQYDGHEFKKKLQKVKSKASEIEDMDLDEILSFHQQLRKVWL